MTTYAEFLESKRRIHAPSGIDVSPSDMHPSLFPFQAAIVSWVARKGRACVFAGTGLGKTRMQVQWAELVCPDRALIVAPLAVAEQTVLEAKELGIDVNRVHFENDVKPGISITNYDRLHQIDATKFGAVVLDESSILKSHDGATRQMIQETFSRTPYKLACSATPSPNDYMELGTHSEFMGAMTRLEMLATYFTHDGGDTAKWRLKRHGRRDFWSWVGSWACVLSHPRDIGFDQDGYDLPDLSFTDHLVYVESSVCDGLFGDGAVNATNLHQVLRDSAEDRAAIVAGLVNQNPSDPWLIWVNTDNEQKLIEKMIPGIASVKGSDKEQDKVDRLVGFASSKYKHLVTKPSIAGFGMNWQHCNNVVFCGITYSFEQMYQAIRRCWRFGQKNPVSVHTVTCNAQESVKSAVKAKQEAFEDMAREMSRYCSQEVSL